MKPNFKITNKMINLIVQITQTSTQLEIEKERNIQLRKGNRIRSVHSSLAIEKNSLSIEQVTDIVNGKRVLGPPKEIREVQNAYEIYENVFKMNPYSIEDFLAAHDVMTKDLVKESGQFRSGDVGVYDGNGNVVHLGARPQFIYELVKELFDWAKKDETPDLIKSCIVHFEIEMIHPFSDGNGRMGRLWQNLILSKWQKIYEWIPVETIIYENQKKYYDMLEDGNKDNDLSSFIEFMLEVILETVSGFGKSHIEDEIKEIIGDKDLSRLSDKELEFFNKLHAYLEENGEVTNSKAAELSGRPTGTTRRYLLKFVDMGIFMTTGENKNRKYVLVKK